jgi:hypothetical protein
MTVTCSLFIDLSLFFPSEWRFETKTEIIGKRRPAIQTRRIAALARLINNTVLTMSWLIFLALLLPVLPDPQLGRVAGFPEDEITAAGEYGDRASFIETAIKRAEAK